MNKMKRLINILVLGSLMGLLAACTDDTFGGQYDRVVEGIPVTVRLGFQSSEATVETRSAQGQGYEDRVHNVYILIFDEHGDIHDRFFCKPGSGLSYDTGNDLLSSGYLIFNTTSLNNATIVGIANLADGSTSTAYSVARTDLDAVTTLDELKSMVMTMRDQSVYRSAYFMMTGYAKVKNPAVGTDPTLVTIPALEAQQTATLECTLQLERTDAKVQFDVSSEVPEGKTWTEFSFQPTGWSVKQVPNQSLILPKDEADASGNWDADGEGCTYFDSPSQEFETFNRDKNGLYKGGSFVFYMPENRKAYQNEIESSEYAFRDKRKQETDADNNVTLGGFEYANDNSTYVEITGLLSYFEEVNNVEQLVYANVRFTVHLGYARGDVNDYSTCRNHFYTYKITVKGVDNITVDVDDNSDPRPGYDGDVVVNFQSSYQFDSHYDRRLIKLNKSGFLPKGDGGTAGTLRWGVSTPFSRGVHEVVADAQNIKEEMRDYRWIKFAINNDYGVDDGELVKYPGDQNYNDPFPLSGAANNQPSPYYKDKGYSDARLLDVNQLMWRLQTEAAEESSDLFDTNGDVYITAFVDENVYAYNPLTNKQDLTLWKRMAETDDRQLYIIVDDYAYTDDQQSSVIKAQYSFRQRSIRTVYNVNKESLTTGWGLESTMETGRLEPGTLPVESSGWWGTIYSTTDRDNGRLNTLRILLGNDYGTNPTTLHWTDVLSVEKDGEYALRSDGNTDYNKAIYACLIRNRDIDGDNIVDADEIRWYLASINQLVDIYLGEYALDEQSRLYPTDAVDRPGGKSVYWHYTSSSYEGSGNNPWVLWAEEGASLGRWEDSKGSNGKDYSYRCLRNLGLSLDAPDDRPADLITVHRIGSTRGYQIDVSNMNENSRRTNLETELAAHNERQADNRPYTYFEVHPNYFPNDNTSYAWDYYQTHDVCPDGYRIPNQRELLIMSTRLPSGAWTDDCPGNYYMSQTGFSLKGKAPYTDARVGFILHKDGNFLLVNGGETGVVRPVKDITSITAAP